jgi:hypothetical protein
MGRIYFASMWFRSAIYAVGQRDSEGSSASSRNVILSFTMGELRVLYLARGATIINVQFKRIHTED